MHDPEKNGPKAAIQAMNSCFVMMSSRQQKTRRVRAG